ncbi:MAG: LysR family transcriptional regulator [Azonexus sp.]|jgi:DNA-binding transcriptional LysR family regulator|nr:LysR family transcriptional regulator [Azonexus sp.]
MDKLAALPGNFASAPNWDDVRYALALGRCASLVAAARQLGVDQTTVSRRLRTLESDLGTPLFERRKGLLMPTSAGLILIERGQRMEQEMAALCHLVADSQSQVQGVIRITAVDALVSHYLVRHLAQLRGLYPGLAVELIASSRSLDLGRREADIAVRLARPVDGDYVMRCLGKLAYSIYGAAHRMVEANWADEAWVAYEHALDQVPEMLWLAQNVGHERVSFRCNNMDALATAVADGVGLGILPRFLGERHAGIACISGAVPVLEREMWLVLPRELREIPRIRAVSDWLVQRFTTDGQLFV